MMSKVVSNIAFSFLLLFQTASMAEEETSPTDVHVETQELQELEAPESTEGVEQEAPSDANREESETTEPQQALSEAEKEALDAEMAELRESGFYDEPVEE